MCVFLTLRLNKAQIKKQYDMRGVDDDFFWPVYVQSAFEFPNWPVIASDRPDHVSMMTWGLIPHWVKDEAAALKLRASTVNARIETASEKPSFRKAMNSSRCLVLADGFFEFREVNKQKYPYFIQLSGGKPFAMAGLFDTWANTATGEMLASFSILTTAANPLLEKIHNRKKRMPVILTGEAQRDWIGFKAGPSDIRDSFPMAQMEAWTVSRMLTRRDQDVNVPEVLKPIIYPEIQMLDSLNVV